MSVTAILLVILLGILLLVVEFLVIPGLTIAGIAGTLLIIGGVYSGYYFHQVPVGNYILLGCVALIFGVFMFVLKTKTWQKMGLKTEIDGRVGVLNEGAIHKGDTGKSISRLNPIGKAVINDITFEVRSNGGYLDQGIEIIVIRIDGNKIFVKPLNN